MAEQQLIDYIKKARSAGQSDDRTRSLLKENGWNEAEVNETLLFLNQESGRFQQPSQPKTPPQAVIEPEIEQIVQSQPELQRQPQVSGEAQVRVQPNPVAQSQQRYQPNMAQERMARSGGTLPIILKLLAVIILLIVIGVGGYFALWQTDLMAKVFNKAMSYFTPKAVIVTPTPNNSANNQPVSQTSEPETVSVLSTKSLVSISADYDVSKITVSAFNKTGDASIYCAPLKTNLSAISCFLNDQKLLDNPFAFKPYWIGISPDEARVVFLYYDSAKKQAFVYENGKEGTRYNGTITYPIFSSDSKNFMFMVMSNDGKNFIVLDDKSFAPHDKVFTPPQLSPDGKYILYGARDGQDVLWVADEIQ
ncbi:MAG: hypothetical protein Q8Q48_01115 [Candidatus Staskawiczbacteria bacterium]|nr:hypothetical protein [Candidatus Staskawiczbacteria bacterium]